MERDAAALRAEVREMREKMRATLDRSGNGRFDVKQGVGGVADIEFMVQYLALRWAHHHPDLLGWTDNIRQLETLARQRLLEGDTAQRLMDAYRAFRAVIHRNALQEEPALAPDSLLGPERQMVQGLWRNLMEV